MQFFFFLYNTVTKPKKSSDCFAVSLSKSVDEKVSLFNINKKLEDKIKALEISLSNKNDELCTKLEDLEKYKMYRNEYERENAELKNKVSELTTKIDNAMTGTDAASLKHKDVNIKTFFSLWHNHTIIISYSNNS